MTAFQGKVADAAGVLFLSPSGDKGLCACGTTFS